MSIVLVRIDDRLIHGQIVQGWLKAVDVDVVLIASDTVSQDETQQILMAMAIPSNVKLVIENLEDATSKVVSGQYAEKK
jgi:mannose/fructose/N-acetylgalactosamine-specific phosphotransferase system component IIB